MLYINDMIHKIENKINQNYNADFFGEEVSFLFLLYIIPTKNIAYTLYYKTVAIIINLKKKCHFYVLEYA